MLKPAIVAVGYNRPEGMKRLLNSIGQAKYDSTDIALIVSIDESNKSDEVEKVAREFYWSYGEKIIRRFPERQGLRRHIVQCGDLSEKYGGVIILEDDLIVAEDYYMFVCRAHEKYSACNEVCGVSLYSYGCNVFTHYPFSATPSISDVYLGQMVVTWGQSWTKEQWGLFKQWYLDHEDKLPNLNPIIPRDISGWTRSWGRYFATYMSENNLSYVYPKIARSTCFSDFGEHNKTSIPLTFVQVPLMHGIPTEYCMDDVQFLERFDSFYERIIDEQVVVSGIQGNHICVDINNMKTSAEGKKYILSNEKLPFEKIASFGLTLKPIILNVIENIPGDQIFLYRINSNDCIRLWKGRRPKYYSNLRRLKFEFNDAPWRVLIRYAPKEFVTRMRDKLIK